jgi:hypothetical protein
MHVLDARQQVKARALLDERGVHAPPQSEP